MLTLEKFRLRCIRIVAYIKQKQKTFYIKKTQFCSCCCKRLQSLFPEVKHYQHNHSVLCIPWNRNLSVHNSAFCAHSKASVCDVWVCKCISTGSSLGLHYYCLKYQHFKINKNNNPPKQLKQIPVFEKQRENANEGGDVSLEMISHFLQKTIILKKLVSIKCCIII